jgi:hypothetical protein
LPTPPLEFATVIIMWRTCQQSIMLSSNNSSQHERWYECQLVSLQDSQPESNLASKNVKLSTSSLVRM